MTQVILKIILFLYLYGISSSSFRPMRFESIKNLNSSVLPAKEEFIGGQWHQCYRNCDDNVKRTCKYTFVLKQYTSMSYACRDCPFNKDDCFLNGCITAGGHIRPVTVANHMLPGPSIQVCEGDKIRVNVINNFASDSATIHWHGIHQIDTPFMDGVPYITQCPILPHNKFIYEFNASPAGTHIWHSHIGFEEADGLYGSLIVRKPSDPLKKYYDYDLAEHVMTIWHWYDMSTVSKLATVLHRYSSVYGYSFLINGLSSKAKFVSQNNSYETPKEIFHVNKGKRYRFRVMFNSPIYCPVQVSVDNHQLLMIASESGVFEPVLVDTFIINAGERYDFVLDANQKPDNYWIRYRGMGDCNKNGIKISEVGILHYNNTEENEPKGSTSYEDGYRSGVLLNPMAILADNYSNNSVIKVTELNNTEDKSKDISRTPDHIFYYKFSFNTYMSHYAPGPYPQINDISFEYPSVPLLTQHDDLSESSICYEENYKNKECLDGLCKCPLVYRVKKDSLVEMIFLDVADDRDQDHPVHLHGHDFHVVAMVSMGANVSFSKVKRMNDQGLIEKKFNRAPIKDNVSVPAKGFTVIRFVASNPGYWFLHCHLVNHMEMGMGFILKVGEHSQMTRSPSSFPKCGNYHHYK
ncbi:uncharacterized protein LOC130672020 isoform X1 [Microplitis mediator]|uniref:uncharacterized protein LOC130672020 isoform X1 n=1 Tax=Microplitis mediator TaxID=375433 RepID=UPI002555648F|nr:uncharacterized protein LOC130672020 isoform X1 [Microplitis mediator]XP_057332185.1 uncharacterized protein LOC130672020 isoform X1 [Microplitis mediator]